MSYLIKVARMSGQGDHEGPNTGGRKRVLKRHALKQEKEDHEKRDPFKVEKSDYEAHLDISRDMIENLFES